MNTLPVKGLFQSRSERLSDTYSLNRGCRSRLMTAGEQLDDIIAKRQHPPPDATANKPVNIMLAWHWNEHGCK